MGVGIRDKGVPLACAGPPPVMAGGSDTSVHSALGASPAAAAKAAAAVGPGASDLRRAARGAALVYRTRNLLSGVVGWIVLWCNTGCESDDCFVGRLANGSPGVL